MSEKSWESCDDFLNNKIPTFFYIDEIEAVSEPWSMAELKKDPPATTNSVITSNDSTLAELFVAEHAPCIVSIHIIMKILTSFHVCV